MSASVWDTVEIPATSHEVLVIEEPGAGPPCPDRRLVEGGAATGEGADPSDRRAMREGRRRERRRRRLYALSGVAVLAAFLFATVIVMDVVR